MWRPFSDDSPWNTPIAQDAALDPDSDVMIADFESSSQFGEHLDISIDTYSIPLYWADASTPKYPVLAVNVGGEGWTSQNGSNATAQMPIPDGAQPDPQTDHHLLVVDQAQNLEWGCWNMQEVAPGTWEAGVCATSDLSGTGVRVSAVEANPWYLAHGARACGFPLIAGLIRPEELEAGAIEHALVVGYPHIRSGFYRSPASTAQAGNGNGAQPDRGIPCGGRIQYDPSIDVDALDISDAGKVVLRALQKYGAYVGDFSGAISLYADNAPDAKAYYSGKLDMYELRDKIDLADFRVLELGPLSDNGNG